MGLGGADIEAQRLGHLSARVDVRGSSLHHVLLPSQYDEQSNFKEVIG
jgi:hypothetical protein